MKHILISSLIVTFGLLYGCKNTSTTEGVPTTTESAAVGTTTQSTEVSNSSKINTQTQWSASNSLDL